MQCKSLRDSDSVIRNFELKYFMASSADSVEVLSRFKEENEASFTMLSDKNGAAAKAFGAYNPIGFAKRWTFYVDDNGKILKVDKSVNVRTAGQDLAENLSKLGFPRR